MGIAHLFFKLSSLCTMAFDRSESRNIHFFDERNPDVVLGGLVQNSLVTERKFLSILSIILVATAPIYVCAGVTGNAVSVIDELPGLGDYMVRCEGKQVWFPTCTFELTS